MTIEHTPANNQPDRTADAPTASCIQKSQQVRRQASGFPNLVRGMKRFLRLFFCAMAPVAALHASGSEAPSGITETSANPTASALLGELTARVNSLLEASTHPLAEEHLRATLCLMRDSYEKGFGGSKVHLKREQEFIRAAKIILEKLPVDRFDFEDHVSRGLPFVFTFVSDSDQTLQYFALQLPYGWKPDRRYPLVVYLHGKGHPNPLIGLTTAFDNSIQDTLFNYEKIDPDAVPALHQSFVVAPWGRGNHFYESIAGDDVFQSVDIVKNKFLIDENRQYLTGFSMGGYGAWRLGTRSPDSWAGIAVAGMRISPQPHEIENAGGLPVVLWGGETDVTTPVLKALHETLQKHGFETTFTIAPSLGHTYPYSEYLGTIEKLFAHTRPDPPTSFNYVVTEPRHNGRNGIHVERVGWGMSPEEFPRISCRIEGKKITINTINAKNLSLQPEKMGFAAGDEIEVIWNGKPAYSGPAKDVKLPQESAKNP